ncbi:hypothetical protein D3C73_1516040 [compost metagenome]
MGYAAKQPSPYATVLVLKIKLTVFSKRYACNAQLFFRFTAGRFKHLLISLNNTTRGSVQHAGQKIFCLGTTLNQNFAHTIMHDDIRCAMT